MSKTRHAVKSNSDRIQNEEASWKVSTQHNANTEKSMHTRPAEKAVSGGSVDKFMDILMRPEQKPNTRANVAHYYTRMGKHAVSQILAPPTVFHTLRKQ